MQRIATATKAVDLYGAGKHGFRDGNLALGITPTDLEAAWVNGVQEEIIAVIEAAGLAPSSATLNQLLTALRSAGVHTTPAQFDNTTKAATTAFVQRAIGGFGQFVSYGTAGQTIPASQANSHFNLFGTCSSITLPLANSVPAGSVLMFDGVSLSCTINRQGTNTIFLNAGNNAATSLVVNDGESAMFVSDGSVSWFGSGTACLKYASGFGASLASNGYQKLPSGLIVQWGTAQFTGVTSISVTFPIAFPNARHRVLISQSDSASTYFGTDRFAVPSLTGFSAKAGVSGFNADWLAIGN